MKNTMEHRGDTGSVEFSVEDKVFFGKVLGIKTLLSYEGTNAEELLGDFHGVVDDYLAYCADNSVEPERAYKGSFNVRVSADLHKQAAIYAIENNISLNCLVEKAMEQFLVAHLL